MEQEKLEQNIAEYYSKLPKNAQEMFSNMQWINTLQDIARKYSLTEIQIQSLGSETTLLLLGMIHPEDYTKFLKTNLSVPAEISGQITIDVNKDILNPFRAELEETYAKNVMEAGDQEYGQGKPLDERFADLPKEIQDTIAESDYQNTLVGIGKKNKLSIEQMGELEKDTTKVLLGLLHPDDFTKALEADLSIPLEQANIITNDVNEAILKDIRDILKSHLENGPTVAEGKSVSAEDIVVPLPPYMKAQAAQSKAPIQQVPAAPIAPKQTESAILGNAGIEMIADDPATEQKSKIENTLSEANLQKDTNVLQNSGIDVVPDVASQTRQFVATSSSRTETLSGIENPPTLPSSIIGAKLSGTIVQPPKLSDYTIAKSSSALLPDKNDKYLEPIE